MKVLDVSAVAAVAREHPHVRLVVDNTFASPALQKPLARGSTEPHAVPKGGGGD